MHMIFSADRLRIQQEVYFYLQTKICQRVQFNNCLSSINHELHE
jgi:hypothetical protein